MEASLQERTHVLSQLNMVTHTVYQAGELHRVRRVPDVRVLTLNNQAKTPEQVTWYLEHEKWEDDVITTCGVAYCTTHIALASENPVIAPASEANAPAPAEDQLTLQLQGVARRKSASLADLYRRGRERGLLSARSDYR